jgi:hypothetical protein
MKRIISTILVALIALSSCENKKDKPSLSKSSLYEIKVAGRYGLIDSTGTIVVNPQFDEIFIPYHDKNYDLIAVRLGTKIGFIDRKVQNQSSI